MATHTTQQKVMVGMSGGVDSSVSALLLQQQGYEVEGLFMKNWDEDDGTEYCTAKQDLADAQQICQRLNIPLHTANFAAEYWDNVFQHFLNEYQAGRTPNPDVLCNKEIKFKVFLQYAKMLGADLIATGHYVRKRCIEINGELHTQLLKGLDNNKDQSYFLCAVGEQDIAQCLFPVGELEKPKVRRIAQSNDLITYNKKDSTGICFIGERRFKDFLANYLPAQPGDIETIDGKKIGVHQGLMYHTIGQRQGLGIGGVADADESPWYVTEKDLQHNVLKVVQGNDHPALFCNTLEATALNWISGLPLGLNSESLAESKPTSTLKCQAKTRYRQPDQDCTLTLHSSNQCTVVFDTPQRAVTPGQYVVFYQDEQCLGGGIIQSTANT